MAKIIGKIESASWGFYNFKADATKCANELLELPDGFKPSDVVEYARNEDSELHKCFTWDDTKAAQKYREREASMVIANLKIKYVKPEKPEEPKTIRMFYSLDKSINGQKRGYRPLSVIVKNEDEYERLLTLAKGELKAFRNKYEKLAELSQIFELIDEL